MELDILINKYIEKFNEPPYRIGFEEGETELMEKIKYCLINDVTIDYFYKEEEDVLH